jgi:3-oxoacyl-[acyl-carrier protein] reductase
MKTDLSRAVITGGAGSLARATAAALREPGWIIDSPDRTQLDVTNPAAVDAFFATRRVDLLVCAAGIIRDAPLARMSGDDWDAVWAVNYPGARACAKAVLPGMKSRASGHIVFISSFSAIHPPPGQAAYAAAKAAILGLVSDLAKRHGPDNVRVNAILPGFLETRMTQNLSAKRRAELLREHVLGRFNMCEQVGKFIHFLHHHLPHTSGQVFQLDSRIKHGS